jgi:ATP-dependent Clp endopeptidase proteolytic subunit ClpP
MNEIKLYGAIGYPGMTSAAFKSLLAQCDPSQELVVRIDSEGGSVFDGFGIFDAIKAFEGPTRAVVESSAFSIASFIAMAADKVEITENGYLMLHNPWTQVEGDDAELAKQAGMLAGLKQNMIAAYAEKTGKTAEEVEQMMATETWLGAADAQASGLVDAVLPTARRSVAAARFSGNMPERVQSSLSVSDHPSGAIAEQKEQTPMSSNQKPVATVKSIQARFGKASPEFIVAALAAEMTDEQVAESYYSEMVKENEELKAKLAAMEQEMVALKAKAEMTVEEEEEEEVMARPAAKARPGVAPVAAVAPAKPPMTTRAQWDEVIASYVAKGISKPAAAKRAIREYRELHQALIAEANNKS